MRLLVQKYFKTNDNRWAYPNLNVTCNASVQKTILEETGLTAVFFKTKYK